jgi:hypothetical protein
VTFESGSKLQEIQECALPGCPSLSSICLPAAVSKIDAMAFVGSSIAEIVFDGENPNYFVSWPFLIGLNRTTLVRFIGLAENVIIRPMDELNLPGIERSAFAFCSTLRSLAFRLALRFWASSVSWRTRPFLN